jgi:hypothetical protein
LVVVVVVKPSPKSHTYCVTGADTVAVAVTVFPDLPVEIVAVAALT